MDFPWISLQEGEGGATKYVFKGRAIVVHPALQWMKPIASALEVLEVFYGIFQVLRKGLHSLF